MFSKAKLKRLFRKAAKRNFEETIFKKEFMQCIAMTWMKHPEAYEYFMDVLGEKCPEVRGIFFRKNKLGGKNAVYPNV